MVTLPPRLSRTAYSKPTFEEFQEAAIKERSIPPIGLEMLEYVSIHPEQQKVIFPNPAKVRS